MALIIHQEGSCFYASTQMVLLLEKVLGYITLSLVTLIRCTIVGTSTVTGEIIMKVWIGAIIPEATIIVLFAKKNVPVIRTAVLLNVEVLLTIVAGGKLENALQCRSENIKMMHI